MCSFLRNSIICGSAVLLPLVCVEWRTAVAGGAEEASLVKRVRHLEDAEEIKNLWRRYTIAIDDLIADPAASLEIIDLFVDDFVVEYDQFGTYTDKPSLQFFLENVISPAYSWGFHASHNPRITIVSDDMATGEWYFTADVVAAGTTEVVNFYGRYSNVYVRTVDGWRIKEVHLDFDSPPTP